jgi:hypothetical protein
MPRRQGERLSDHEVHRIRYLLVNTEMTIDEIARRTHRSKSAIHAINRKFKIRQYRGRTAWTVGTRTPAWQHDFAAEQPLIEEESNTN